MRSVSVVRGGGAGLVGDREDDGAEDEGGAEEPVAADGLPEQRDAEGRRPDRCQEEERGEGE